MVYLQLRRSSAKIFYYLTRTSRQEIDFIAVDKHGKPTLAVQVCMSLENSETSRREIEPLAVTAKYFGIKQSVIVTMCEERNLKVDACNIRIVPAWKWMLEMSDGNMLLKSQLLKI